MNVFFYPSSYFSIVLAYAHRVKKKLFYAGQSILGFNLGCVSGFQSNIIFFNPVATHGHILLVIIKALTFLPSKISSVFSFVRPSMVSYILSGSLYQVRSPVLPSEKYSWSTCAPIYRLLDRDPSMDQSTRSIQSLLASR